MQQTILIIFMVSIQFLNADPTINNQVKKPESFEEIGVRILNALIKFGKMELTKAQIKLLQNGNPEQTKLFEQIPFEEMALGDLLQKVEPQKVNDTPKEMSNNWITVETSGNRFNDMSKISVPQIATKNPNEQFASHVMERVQKQIIPDIVKKLVNQQNLPSTYQQITPTMMSPQEQQRQKYLEHERLFHQVINEQDNAKIVQPLRFDIRSQINPLPPDKKYKIEEEFTPPSFKLNEDSIIVNGSSESEDDLLNELENNDYSSDEKTKFKRVISHKNAFARRFLLMK